MADISKQVAVLIANGFIVGDRDRKMNTAFRGRYMVAQSYEPGHSQRDGSGGVWCVVGDSLERLVMETLTYFGFEDAA